MRFKGLNLNLLAIFDVLMQTRSVSAAAKQMNVSQPAMSSSLSQLRAYFRDDILVTQGKRMYPTAFAEAVMPQVRHLLAEIDGLLMSSSAFEPATSERTFRLIVSDYVVTAILVPLIEQLALEAPSVRLELSLPSDKSESLIIDGKADLYVSPEGFMMNDQPSELLFEEHHVVAGWSENPFFAGPMDTQALLSNGHVGVRIGDHRFPAFADRQLSLMGVTRRIEVEASSFTAVPWLLCNTNRLALMHERLAKRMAERFPLAWAPVPFAFPVMREVMQYHRTRSNDEGLAWLRRRLKEAAAARPHAPEDPSPTTSD